MKYFAAILSVLLAATTLSAADITGEWEFTAKVLNDFAYRRVTLKAEGEKLSGNLNEINLDGAIKGNELTFKGTRPNGVVNLITGAATATYTVITANRDTVVFQSDFTTAPTTDGVTFEGTYTVVGGTGRFSGATGSGALDGSAVFTGENVGVGEFTFEGTISSPRSR